MKEKFSEKELNILKDTIIKLFYSVALADGKIDNEEWNLFLNTIRNYEEVENKLLSDLIQNIDFSSPINNNRIKNLDLNNVLNQVNEILNKNLNEKEINEFKLYLVSFSFKIAESSMHYFSDDVTKDERKVINDIISFLNLVDYDIEYIKSIKDKLPNVIYEGIFSKIINFSGDAMSSMRAYLSGAMYRLSGPFKNKKEIYDHIDYWYTYGIQKMDSQGIEGMKEVVKLLKTDADNGVIKKGVDFCKKITEYTGLNLCK